MDRREALKKLAAGGAIAAGGSLVLSSNAVAQISSCAVPVVPPVAGAAFTRSLISTTPNQNQMRLTPTAAMIVGGVVPTYAWRIRSYANMSSSRGLRIRSAVASGSITQSTTPNSCPTECQSSFVSGNGDVIVSRFNTSTPVANLALRRDSGSTYSVEALVTWNKAGCPPVTATYRFSGAGRSLPSVTPVP